MKPSVLDIAWNLREFLEQQGYCLLLPEIDRWLREYNVTGQERRDEILQNHLDSLKGSPYFLKDVLAVAM